MTNQKISKRSGKQRSVYIKNFLIPCLFFSVATGIGTGILIFLFKQCANLIISLSSAAYGAVRENPQYLPYLLLGAAVLGVGSSLLLRFFPGCRGGGIPTAIAILRGIVTFRWLRSILSVFSSAMITYLCGVPLGNEGPSVQMGTAVGKGIVSRHPAWSRYIMTGGASAGFAAATGAPLTGILFAFEEAHRRFSPLLFLAASLSTLTGTAVIQGLSALTDTPYTLFQFHVSVPLPLKHYWTAIVIGILVGLAAALFTKCYQSVRHLILHTLKKVPRTAKVTLLFVLTALIGFFAPNCIGSGHDLVHELMEGHGVVYSLLLVFLVRALLLLAANNSDVTGGLFVPTLAFGAILGAVSGKVLIDTHLLPAEFYSFAVITGITAFLSASSRTPLMALTFAFEILGAGSNLLPVAIGGAVAFLTIETIGIHDFTDTVVEAKAEAARAAYNGKPAEVVDLTLTVAPDSFAEGKEIRDILWPPYCMILSVKRTGAHHTHSGTGIQAGDTLTVHCSTYDPADTLARLEALVGKQKEDVLKNSTSQEEDAPMPEI